MNPQVLRTMDLTDPTRRILSELVGTHLTRHGGELLPSGSDAANASAGDAAEPRTAAWRDGIEILDASVLLEGRPGLVDVLAEVDGDIVHLVLGLRAPGDESHFLSGDEGTVLGLYEDDDGLAVAFDALLDSELVGALVGFLTDGQDEVERVRPMPAPRGTYAFALDDRLALNVFNRLSSGSNGTDPVLEMLTGLDRAGFNHVAAPLLVWRHRDRDLGFLQELMVGGSDGWALALTSLRDLYASACSPEEAGGDFASEARALGTMTARMHLALDSAWGRRPGDVVAWTEGIRASVLEADPDVLNRHDVQLLLSDVQAMQVPCQAIRTHGDYHLGRVSRIEQGWYVSDLTPGGIKASGVGMLQPGFAGEPLYRSPLADVADMLWSFRHVAMVAATERDPNDSEGLSRSAAAWERRNRRAFLAGYLNVAGIGGLVPPPRSAVRKLTAAFELERSALNMVAKSLNPLR